MTLDQAKETYSPEAAAVIRDLCHVLGVKPTDVLNITITAGRIRVGLVDAKYGADTTRKYVIPSI